MQGAFNTETKRQLEICKRLPLKLDFEATFKEARVDCPTPRKHTWRFWQRLTKAPLSCWVQRTVSHLRALAHPKAPNRQAAGRVGIRAGLATASAKGGRASAANSQQRQQSRSERRVHGSAHVCSVRKLKSRFLQSQLTSRARTGRAHLQHLCPTGSWITRDNHEPPDAGARLVVLVTISVSAAHRGLQEEPDVPLLCPFHDKAFHEALALKPAKVDQKYYKLNGTAGKNNGELAKVHESLLWQNQKLKPGILSPSFKLRHSLQSIYLTSPMLLSPLRHDNAMSSIK